jgi:hypothetical protein
MDQWEITYNTAAGHSETVDGTGAQIDPHWATLYDDSGSVVWCAPSGVVLSLKKVLPASVTSAVPETATATVASQD